MSDKLQTAREYILRKIENGELRGGDKLPAAREYSDELGVSLAITQMAFTSLTRDGILTSVPRQGTYVRKDWNERILPGSFQTFRPVWKEVLGDLISRDIPGVRVCDKFRNGIYEINTTWAAQFRQEEYLDLAGLFEEVYPERGDFFMSQFHSSYSRNGKLYGIPLIFSPWVISCNIDMIRRAGAEVPQPGWSWTDFITLVRQLRQVYPPEQTITLFQTPSFWMSFLFRAGGAIVVRENDRYDVRLDNPQTMNGFRKLRELQQVLQASGTPSHIRAKESFLNGTMALFGGTREDMNFNSDLNWICVPLPVIPGGIDRTRQASDLFCVRKQANDFEEVKAMIRLLLSPEVQERLGKVRYGIPIRRSAAIRSFDEEDPRDAVFFSEMTRISPDCSLAWPELYQMVFDCMNRIWQNNLDPEAIVPELASAMRIFIDYNSPPPGDREKRQPQGGAEQAEKFPEASVCTALQSAYFS